MKVAQMVGVGSHLKVVSEMEHGGRVRAVFGDAAKRGVKDLATEPEPRPAASYGRRDEVPA